LATIEKRTTSKGNKYRVKVRINGFPPETATFVRLTDAKDWARLTESNIKAGRHFGQGKRHTFDELVDEYLPHAKDAPRLAYWRNVFGPERLDAITPPRIAKERDKLLSEETQNFAVPPTGDPEKDAKRPKAKRTRPTANRYLAALSACLSYGVKTLQWLERNPCERITKSRENKGRVRFLSDRGGKNSAMWRNTQSRLLRVRTKPSNYPEPFASRMAGRQKHPWATCLGYRPSESISHALRQTRCRPSATLTQGKMSSSTSCGAVRRSGLMRGESGWRQACAPASRRERETGTI